MAKRVQLTQGFVALVDDEDYAAVVAAGPWQLHRRDSRSTHYARRGVTKESGGRTTQSLHQFLTGWAITDHINGDGLNNCRSNLREATHAENMRNSRRRVDSTSGFKGVSWESYTSKWRAFISIDGKRRFLGRFSDPEEAARAFDAAAIEVHGPFARLNFPREGEAAA